MKKISFKLKDKTYAATLINDDKVVEYLRSEARFPWMDPMQAGWVANAFRISRMVSSVPFIDGRMAVEVGPGRYVTRMPNADHKKRFLSIDVKPGRGDLYFPAPVGQPKADGLILCEGPFDGIGCAVSGFRSVAIFGSVFTDDQLSCLYSTIDRPGTVLVALDPNKMGRATKIARMLEWKGFKPLVISSLIIPHKDLGSMNPEQIEFLMDKAQRLL